MHRFSILAAYTGIEQLNNRGWFGKRSSMKTNRILLAFLALAIPAVVIGQIGIRVAGSFFRNIDFRELMMAEDSLPVIFLALVLIHSITKNNCARLRIETGKKYFKRL